MDIFETLKKDHDELKPLLDKLVQVSEINNDSKALLKRVSELLIPHSRAEEAVFYNSLRETEKGREKVRHSYGEHAQAETILRTLQGLEVVGVEWTGGTRKLRDALNHHISEEEGEIFKFARQELSEEEAKKLAKAFTQLKQDKSEQGFAKNTIDMVINLMPGRFVEAFRTWGSSDPKNQRRSA